MDTKNIIKQALREADESNQEKETKGPSDLNTSEKTPDNPQYDQIQILLKDNIYNHAAIMERLWGDNNATYRSEFGKRLHKEVHDGSKHMFSDKEISEIASILQNTAAAINGAFDGPVKDERGLEKNYGQAR